MYWYNFSLVPRFSLEGSFHTNKRVCLTLKPTLATIMALIRNVKNCYKVKPNKPTEILLLTIKFPLKQYHWQNHLMKLELKRNHPNQKLLHSNRHSLHANRKWP